MGKKKKEMQEGIVCPNHPNTQAVDRCHACHKPVCGDCVHELNDRTYCSVQCGADDARTTGNIDKQKKKLPLGKIVVALVILGAIGGGVYYFKQNPDKWEKVKEEGEKGISQVKKQAASIDPKAKLELNKMLDQLQFSVDNETAAKALAFFTPNAAYVPAPKDGVKARAQRAAKLIAMFQQYSEDDFKIDKDGSWKRNKDGTMFMIDATCHMLKREITGNINRILPVRIRVRKVGDGWKIDRIQARGELVKKRGA